jgi:hypothetical protein
MYFWRGLLHRNDEGTFDRCPHTQYFKPCTEINGSSFATSALQKVMFSRQSRLALAHI